MVGLQKKTLELIEEINGLLETYGTMTVRQVYYQIVPYGFNYRQVAYALTIAREKGLIDLDRIIDRSRPSYGLDTWYGPHEVFKYMSETYKLDYWADSPYRVEIWSEKDALSAVISEEAEKYRVPVRVTRGFLSTSNKHAWSDENKVILYFGDFDPSGLCIDFNLGDSILLDYAELHRIALTKEMVEKYDLPYVKVKNDDPRAPEYKKLYGDKGYELDALNPNLLRQLVRTSIEGYVNFDIEQKRMVENTHRQSFKTLCDVWGER